jgi:hypothetical protein
MSREPDPPVSGRAHPGRTLRPVTGCPIAASRPAPALEFTGPRAAHAVPPGLRATHPHIATTERTQMSNHDTADPACPQGTHGPGDGKPPATTSQAGDR